MLVRVEQLKVQSAITRMRKSGGSRPGHKEALRSPRRRDPEIASSGGAEKSSSRGQRERGAVGEANEEEDVGRNGGSGKDSPQQ